VLETSRELGVEGLDGIDMACRAGFLFLFLFFLVEVFERSDVMRKCRSHAGELVCEVVLQRRRLEEKRRKPRPSVLLKAAPLDDSLVYILPPCLVCKRKRRVFCSLKRVSNQMLDQRSVRQWEGVTRCEVSIVRIFVPTQKIASLPIRGSRQQRPRFSPELHNSPDTVKSLFRNPFLKPEKRATSLDAV
jgi:hypothetical protein